MKKAKKNMKLRDQKPKKDPKGGQFHPHGGRGRGGGKEPTDTPRRFLP